jgi:hypothetical protein
MKTRVDALETLPRPPKAANDDVVPAPEAAKPSSGWDAYEVWRTRIKAHLDQAGRPQRPG